MPLLFASLRSALDQDHRNSGFLTRRECSRCPAIILPLGRALMAKPWGALSPQAQFLLFCRLGLGTTEEVFSMCDYSLQPLTHHDALEFSDGQIVLLTDLFEHQEATVLQLPAQSVTAAEAKAQERV